MSYIDKAAEAIFSLHFWHVFLPCTYVASYTCARPSHEKQRRRRGGFCTVCVSHAQKERNNSNNNACVLYMYTCFAIKLALSNYVTSAPIKLGLSRINDVGPHHISLLSGRSAVGPSIAACLWRDCVSPRDTSPGTSSLCVTPTAKPRTLLFSDRPSVIRHLPPGGGIIHQLVLLHREAYKNPIAASVE